MTPIADFFNHSNQKSADWIYDKTTDCFNIIAITNVSQDDEIFLSYGTKCNSRFFINYGFTLNPNITKISEISYQNNNECRIFLYLLVNDPAIVSYL